MIKACTVYLAPAFVFLTVVLSACSAVPKDEVLIEHFSDNRQAFEQIVKTLRDYPFPKESTTIFADIDDGIAGVDGALIENIREQLKELDVNSVDINREAGAVNFEMFSGAPSFFAIAPISTYKGFTHLSTAASPEHVRPNLDDLDWQPYRGFLRDIGDGWYLYVSFDG